MDFVTSLSGAGERSPFWFSVSLRTPLAFLARVSHTHTVHEANEGNAKKTAVSNSFVSDDNDMIALGCTWGRV